MSTWHGHCRRGRTKSPALRPTQPTHAGITPNHPQHTQITPNHPQHTRITPNRPHRAHITPTWSKSAQCGQLPPKCGNLPPKCGNLPPKCGNSPPSAGIRPPSAGIWAITLNLSTLSVILAQSTYSEVCHTRCRRCGYFSHTVCMFIDVFARLPCVLLISPTLHDCVRVC